MAASERKYDMVIFGASGVTGKYVIEELANNNKSVKWCVAGRSSHRLQTALKEVGQYINKPLDHVEVIVADVSNEDSMDSMCKSAKIILNCVGPYRFSGEQVVKHCIKNKTHHVDVSGEPQFLETIQMKYFEEAKAQNVYIVGSCGFDSIPSDLGIEFFRKKFPGDMHSVETYLKLVRQPGSSVNFGTWQSAIYGLAHADELISLRKELKQKLFTKTLPKPDYPLKKRGLLFKSDVAKGWCIPFLGSDRSVVMRTQMYNYQFNNERPLQVQCYMKSHSLLYAIATLLMGAVFMLLTKVSFGRYLLEKFPEVFSFGLFKKTPPKREESENGKFKVIFRAKGWSEKLLDPSDKHTHSPNETATAVLSGPDPAYVTTAICLLNSGLVILEEMDRLPKGGGVFTPGAAFSKTSIMERLEKRGITLSMES